MKSFVSYLLSIVFCFSLVLGISLPSFISQQSALAANQPVLISLYMDDLPDKVTPILESACKKSVRHSYYNKGATLSFVCSKGDTEALKKTCEEDLKGYYKHNTSRWQPDYYEDVCQFGKI